MSVLKSPCTRIAALGIVAGATSLLSCSVHAGPIVDFEIAVAGGQAGPFATSFSQVGVATPLPQVYNYQGSLNDPSPFNDWSILNWDFNADMDPSGAGGETGARIASVFTVQNNRTDGAGPNDNSLFFSILVRTNVSPAVAATSFFGNGAMTLTIDESSNGFGGQLAAGNTSIWNFMVNNVDVATLFNPGFVLGGSNGPSTTSTSGNLSAAQTGPLVGLVPTSLGIRLDFILTPGERVTFNGVFGYVPGPTGLAFLGLAGLLGHKRRRLA